MSPELDRGEVRDWLRARGRVAVERGRELAKTAAVALLVLGLVVVATIVVAIVVGETATTAGEPLLIWSAWTLAFAFAIGLPVIVLRVVVAVIDRFGW